MKDMLNKYILLLCLLNLPVIVLANNFKSVLGEWNLRASGAEFEFHGVSILPKMLCGAVGNEMLPISILKDGTLCKYYFNNTKELCKWRYINNDSTLIEIMDEENMVKQYHAYFFLHKRILHLYLININEASNSIELVGSDSCKCFNPDSIYASEIIFTHTQKTIEQDSRFKQKYKYNGKEYDTMHGLNTYDYGARQYDGAKIVWDRMDKLCEKKPWNNPYVFCGGNPVNRIDPDGRDWVEGADGNIVWRNSVVSSNYQKVLNSGEMYRGVDYIRYKNWNNSRAVGLVQEHYLPNKTLSYEVHKGTYQFDFTGEVISSQELTGKQLSSNHAAKGIRGTAYLNAVFSDGSTYTTETYPFTSGPYGNGPTPNHNYTGSDFAYTSQAGMAIGGDRGWKVYLEDFNGRTGLRMHPDTNSPGTAGCIGIQGSAEALAKLGSFLHDYIKTQNKNIQINFIITGNPNYGNNGKANPNIGQ